MAVRDAASLLVGLLVLFHTWGGLCLALMASEDRLLDCSGDPR